MSNMRNDPRMKRVIRRYGLEGYGLYNAIVESIAEKITSEDPSPDLEENSEDIAASFNGDTTHINEMMSYMINQGLFELDEISGRILCSKIYKFLQASQTRSEYIKRLINSYKNVHNLLSQTVTDSNNGDNGKVSQTVTDSLRQSQTVTDCHSENRLEQTRTDKIRTEKKREKSTSLPSVDMWPSFPEFCTRVYKTFETKYAGIMPSQAKQIDAINRLIAMAEQRATTDQDIEIIVKGMMETFYNLKTSDASNKGFWRKQPYTPTALVALWAQVWEEARDAYQDDAEIDRLFEDDA